MQKVRRTCFWCLRKVWQLFAISLVLVAVVVSLLKYSLPYANQYRENIEQLLSEQLNVSLQIGEISAGWEHTGPALVLNDVALGNHQESGLSLTVRQSRLHINVWQSLLQRRLVSNYFVLDGLKTTLVLAHLDSSNTDGSDNSSLIELLETLFLAQSGHFAIENSELELITRQHERRLIALDRITWQNRNTQHQGVGSIKLPGISENQLEIIVDLFGENFADAFGNVYIKSKELNASAWLKDALSDSVDVVESNINFQAWARFKALTVENIQLDWQPSQVNWQLGEDKDSLIINSGTMRLRPLKTGWQVETSALSLGAAKSQWSQFGGNFFFDDGQFKAHWQNAPLALLSTVSPILPFKELHQFAALNLKGEISSLFINYQSEDDFFIKSKLENVSWQHFKGLPGAQNLVLELTADESAAHLNLTGNDDYLMTGDLFTRAVPYQQLQIELELVKHELGWQLQSDNIWLHNKELTFAAEFSLDLFEQAELNLYAEMFGPDALLARNYFPRGYMPKATIDYLNRALRGGRVEQAKVLWQGKLNDFPYQDSNGRFVVDAQVVDGTFSFNQQWPEIKKLDATLRFDNERMDIFSTSGELAGLQTQNDVHVSIDDLATAPWLFVDINTQQQAESLQPFFAKTPLKNSVASVLETVQAKGAVKGLTRISVPIGSNQEPLDVKGKVILNETPVYIAKPGIPFDKVTGELTFDNSDIALKNARTSWLDMPLSFSITGTQQPGHYDLSVEGQAEWQIDDIVKHTKGVMKGYLSGTVPLDINFSMQLKEQGFNYTAHATSNLLGLNTHLPKPYAKSATQAWPMRIDVRGDEISNLITANINEQLYFNSIVDNQTASVSNAHLIVGDTDLGINASGFDVSVQLAEADIIDWIPFIDHLITVPESSEQNNFFPSLAKVKAHLEKATLASVEFNDLAIDLSALAQSTQLKINGKEVRAEVSIPRVLAQRPVFIEADYLRLNFSEGQEAKTSSLAPDDMFGDPKDNEWLTHLPAIRFNCADCKFANYQLEKVALDLDPAENGILISQFAIDKGKHVFNGTGSWQNQRTELTGTLKSKDIGDLTDEFELTSSIKESTAEIAVDLGWYGTPYEFNTQSLSGQMSWRLGDGYITEISDGGARVFSLLSLDSLVRKLKLDFRDVFAKGFFYNSMSGNMVVNNGIARTDDAFLNGVPADLTIKGYTNLNTQEINYQMWVAPEVTSSLPVIVAWMVNPVSGLAALAIDKVLHSARVISEIEYTITGSLEAPVVTEKGKKSREIEIVEPVEQKRTEPIIEQLAPEKPIVPALDASKAETSEADNDK